MDTATETKTLAALIAEIKADGKIDAGEITALNALLYKDGKIDHDELKAVCELNEACGTAEGTDSGWKGAFARIIADGVLKDAESPGKIDKDEAALLNQLFSNDGKIDENEVAALALIKQEATNGIHEDMNSLFERAGIAA